MMESRKTINWGSGKWVEEFSVQLSFEHVHALFTRADLTIRLGFMYHKLGK